MDRTSKLFSGEQHNTLRTTTLGNIKQISQQGRVLTGRRWSILIQFVHEDDNPLRHGLFTDAVIGVIITVLQSIDGTDNVAKNQTLQLFSYARNINNHHLAAVDVQHFIGQIHLLKITCHRSGIHENIIIDGIVDQASEALPRLDQYTGSVIFSTSLRAELFQPVFEIIPAGNVSELLTIINIVQNGLDCIIGIVNIRK